MNERKIDMSEKIELNITLQEFKEALDALEEQLESTYWGPNHESHVALAKLRGAVNERKED